ncbi:E3 ubiquitin-protein ligase Zswim2 [Apiospora saccharicola]|uniref:E3 ubiquitin-protein ligase Zswim2 n=1 Tax=Apiospora saccharicola TaxID=335842 RepID=A0ABR1VF19_9PEZI
MAGQSSQSSSRKRKQPEPEYEYEEEVQEKPKKSRKKKDPNEEKRLRAFRRKAPQAFHEVYQRATTQRFYVLGRTRCGEDWCPEEIVELTGSTGNIYHVHIARQPTCDCPHGLKGNQCKHILYVLSRVLHARFDLVYQLALLGTELQEIFEGAPPIEVGDEAEGAAVDNNRKAIEGDCPICFSEFEATDKTVYCKATCGNNIHTECFEMWAATKRQSPGAKDQVTCPMCRSLWQGDDDVVKKIMNTGVVGREGYVNVAGQLGISGVRGE